MPTKSAEAPGVAKNTTLPPSLALLNFAGTLAKRKPALLGPEVPTPSQLGHTREAESAIILRLTDQAVRVWGAALLELKDRKRDADVLRALHPITDRETLEAATATLAAFDSVIISHAKDCAASAAGEVGTAEFIGCQAAYAAIALANGYDDGRKQAVYDSASALLAELSSEETVAH